MFGVEGITWSTNETMALKNETLGGRNGTGTPQGYSVAVDPFFAKVNGIVSPLLVLITIVTNSFICLVLIKPHMRNPTNTLLLAIAITDALTGVWPLPCYLFFYTLGHHLDWVPFDWCPIVPVLTEYLPTITHTASIWLTVVLAVQRYVCICHFQTAGRRWSTNRSEVVKVIVGVVAVATLTHSTRFFEATFSPVSVTSQLDRNVTVTSCSKDFVKFVAENMNVYFNIYYWFRVVFINLVPCASLLVLNVLLIMTLRSAQRRKVRLLGRNKSDSIGSGGGGGPGVPSGVKGGRSTSESNSSTTMMLVFVVGIFLVVEFPLAILFIVYIVQNTFPGTRIMAEDRIEMASNVVNLAILFSYPINFFIYCSMSRKFRDTFAKMFLCSRRNLDSSSGGGGKTAYFSLATDGESRFHPAVGRPEVIAQTEC